VLALDLKHDGFPVPSDYFGVLWALSGIDDLIILEHGSTGTCNYNAFNYMIMNRQSPKGKLFSSGMDEDDVVMGRDTKIKEAVAELDDEYTPKVIALVATGVTSVIGLDLQGIIEEIQPATNAQLISFSGGGFAGDYHAGIKEAFRSLTNNIIKEPKEGKPFKVNIIGPTIDSFNINSDLAEIKRMLGLIGAEVNTTFTFSTDVDGVENLACASLNLVTRDIGIESAEIMKERYGIPYYYGLPFGVKGSIKWLNDIAEILGLELKRSVLRSELERYGFSVLELVNFLQDLDNLKAAISCPYEYALGLAGLMQEEWGIDPSLVSLPLRPDRQKMQSEFTRRKIGRVLIEPEGKELEEAIRAVNPDMLFGNSYDLLMAKDIAVKVHAAFPAFDHIYRYDGTPFVGLRGYAYLTETLINQLNQNPEVFRN
jgi:light-independent protochlorophyllide reductase B subunit